MFKNRLVELRKEKKITQNELAEKLGFTRASIGKYEGNQGIMPTIEAAVAIADFFDVSLDYLVGRSNIKAGSPEQLSSDESEFLNRYRSLREDDRRFLTRTFIGLSNVPENEKTPSNKSEDVKKKNDFSLDEVTLVEKYRILEDIDKREVEVTIRTLLKHEKYNIHSHLTKTPAGL